MLTAKYTSRQTTLFILHDQPIRLFPAPATTCALCLGLIHEPSKSPAEIQRKNGLARTRTDLAGEVNRLHQRWEAKQGGGAAHSLLL
jgi:hypothetical protein